MKRLIILLAILLMVSFNSLFAQSVGINDDGGIPDGSAILDVKSTTKGLLFPRLTTIERDAISLPAAGLQIYNSDQGCMNYYNGIFWIGMGECFVCGTSTVTDIDGNNYNTVEIGGQCWLKDDIKVSHYPNGDVIPYIDDNSTWQALANDNTSDAYCVYNDNNNDGIVDVTYPDYGYLYSYAAAIGDNWARDNYDNQGVCPDGWHLPTDAEWTELTDFLGSTTDAGGKIKETGTTHWTSPNTGATNESGFSALPNGYRFTDGSYHSVGIYGYWWSATENIGTQAWVRYLLYNNVEAFRSSNNKSYGFSVRCIKD